jgi:outer membrane protein TolC
MSLIVIVLAATVAAEAPVTLTVEEAADRARARALHAQALAARADEEEAQGGLGVRLPDWQLRVGGVSGRRVLSPLAGQGVVGPPLEGSHVGLRVHTPRLQAFTTEQSIARHRAMAEVAELDVAHIARHLHTTVRTLAAQAAIAQRRVAIDERRLALVEQQVSAGVRTRDAVDAQRLRVLRRRARSRDLAAQHHAAQAQLASLVGGEPTALALAPPGGELCRAFDRAAGAAAEMPEVRAWQARAAEASVGSTAGWMRLVPWPDFVQLRYEVGATRAQDDIVLHLGFSLPVGDLGAGEARARRHRARWMGMEAQAEAQRIASEQQQVSAQAASAAEGVSALEAERAAVDDIRARLNDEQARAALEPEAALDLELALLDHEEAAVQAQAQCEAAAWDQIRLGLRLDRAAPILSTAGR